MSASRTITGDKERLDNVHPGDILREDFLLGSEIDIAEVAAKTGIPNGKLSALIAAGGSIDADIDLRLARYFGMSDGFFLGLQNDYDLEEVRRAKQSELDRITRRAA